MRRLRRILLNAATVLSLLLCVATVVLWVRSDLGQGLRIDWPGDNSSAGSELVLFSGEWQWHRYVDARAIDLNLAPAGQSGGIGIASSVVVRSWKAPGVRASEEQRIKMAWDTKANAYRQIGRNYGRDRWLVVSLWIPLLLSLPGCAWAGHQFVQARRRKRLLPRPTLCRGCGYDLRATPDRCPECGKTVAP